MTPEAAETTGLKALGWLISDEDLLGAFMGSTGVSAEDLRRGAGDPGTLASVLAFITMDDAWVRRFCDAEGLPYGAPLAALRALPGGDEMNWT